VLIYVFASFIENEISNFLYLLTSSASYNHICCLAIGAGHSLAIGAGPNVYVRWPIVCSPKNDFPQKQKHVFFRLTENRFNRNRNRLYTSLLKNRPKPARL